MITRLFDTFSFISQKNPHKCETLGQGLLKTSHNKNNTFYGTSNNLFTTYVAFTQNISLKGRNAGLEWDIPTQRWA
jgi:hypothetical protein